MLTVVNEDSRAMFKICAKSIIKVLKRWLLTSFCCFYANFEQILHIEVVFTFDLEQPSAGEDGAFHHFSNYSLYALMTPQMLVTVILFFFLTILHYSI